MRIISWNTNGLRATIKQGYFNPLFDNYQPDIVCFQETKCEKEQLPEEILRPSFAKATTGEEGYHSYFSSSKGKKGYSGVAIYSKEEPNKVEYGIGIPKFDDEGRILIAYYKKFILINCYFPNGGGGEERLKYKLDFYDAFLKFINKMRKKGYEIVFTGDVNTAHEEMDLARPKENEENTGFLPIERAWIDELVNNSWVDIFRYFYPNKKDVYTYWDQKTRARDRNVGWRIDYFFADSKIVSKIKKFSTLSDYYGSDHCPISIDIEI